MEKEITRLNYIGSKFQLLEWIIENIKEKTSWTSFENKKIADIFSGTGIVSYHLRNLNAIVYSNDVELYSSIITHAFTCSVYNLKCKEIILQLNNDLIDKKYTIGFITEKYSPYNGNERMFFTIENAKRIDYTRHQLEFLKEDLNNDEYNFILASIINSADAVSNVPAVYGCYLKKFKAKALKEFYIKPIHKLINKNQSSVTFNDDVLNIIKNEYFNLDLDLVYLDPPYNERQYSKNYFPLNIIAKTPKQLESEPPLKGKTGIPTDCFISPFCKKGKIIISAFDSLFASLKTKWIFLSYNSESTLNKEKIIEIMEQYGTVSIVEKEYKRFKSFDYNKNVQIKEYLFCLKKN